MRRTLTLSVVFLLGVILGGCAATKKQGTVEVEDATISGSDASSTATGLTTGSDATGQIITV
ncbi:MAG TPA: hypothetical protein QGH18_01280, partial [Arenicellales bacterium]|nr:hypothetical protein [Arenicellales bacterium]